MLALLLLPVQSLAQADDSPPQSEAFSSGATLRPSVVALWRLDERTGNTARDSSGHGHHGAISDSITLGVRGKLNTGYRFVPPSNVVVRDAPELRPGMAPITISYWLKTTARPPCCDDYDIFVKGNQWSKGGQIKLEVQRNGQASCMFRGAVGRKELQAGPNVVNGRWHHVVCQRIGNVIVETVDGTSYSVTKATGAIRTGAPVVLGSHYSHGDWYEGALDEVSYAVGFKSTFR